VGAKNSLLDRTLQANLAAFYYDYTDLQLGQRIAGNVRTSNADAVIYGAEAELIWSPTSRCCSTATCRTCTPRSATS
jgi:iron complex outermembrane receptor protein